MIDDIFTFENLYEAYKKCRLNIRTMNKLHEKEIIDDEYINIRKNAFTAHLKYSNDNLLFDRINKKIYN